MARGRGGWRWLFVPRGSACGGSGCHRTWFYLSDWPRDAAWLTGEQRGVDHAGVGGKRSPPAAARLPILETLRSGELLSAAAVAFLAYLPSYATIYWMPTLLKRLSGLSDARVGLLMAIPFGVALLGMLGNGWHSDRTAGGAAAHAAVPVWLLALGALGPDGFAAIGSN